MTCKKCPSGKFGSKTGLSGCSFCPTGQYQDKVGQSACKSCVAEDKLLTNSPDFTHCVVNQALLGDSVIQIMFSNGAALYIAFAISAVFT